MAVDDAVLVVGHSVLVRKRPQDAGAGACGGSSRQHGRTRADHGRGHRKGRRRGLSFQHAAHVEAIRRQLPPGSDPDDLVFTGPGGGGPGVPRGTRTLLSRHNLHRTYHNALAKLADPLRPTAQRILPILRDGGPQCVDQLAARLTAAGRRPIRPATVAAALGELHAAGLAAVDDHDQDELTGRWAALPIAGDPLLDAVDLHGAHDLRHTYATWLEDAGIPARVIDELMGHQASSRGGLGGSAIGTHYRHTTPEMAARVVDAIQQRLTVVLGVAELAVERHPNLSTLRVF
jgi:hypothetical protein